jgi:hypothetical protein
MPSWDQHLMEDAMEAWNRGDGTRRKLSSPWRRRARPRHVAGDQPDRGPAEQAMAFRLTMRDGLVTHFVSYWNRADAFGAMGLKALRRGPPDRRYPCTPGARSSAG